MSDGTESEPEYVSDASSEPEYASDASSEPDFFPECDELELQEPEPVSIPTTIREPELKPVYIPITAQEPDIDEPELKPISDIPITAQEPQSAPDVDSKIRLTQTRRWSDRACVLI